MTGASPFPSTSPVSAKAEPDVTLLLELLASRICHDLVSPVGAINNGLEFIEDMGSDPETLKQAIDLIGQSTQTAAARLQVFRIIYGAGGREANLKPEDIQKAFGTLLRMEGKIRQSWDPYAPLGIDVKAKGACKILLGTLVLAQECLPKGGTIYADAGKNDDLIVTAEGVGAVVREGTLAALSGTIDAQALDPRLIHPYVLGVSARGYGFEITSFDAENTGNNGNSERKAWRIRQTV